LLLLQLLLLLLPLLMLLPLRGLMCRLNVRYGLL
jgi:hypothetical protein